MYKLNWKAIFAVIFIAALATVVGAVILEQYLMPQTVTVEATEFTIYIDEAVWTNESIIDWGTLASGTHQKNMTVTNTGSTNITLTMILQGFPSGWPSGWTETWTCNATEIIAGSTVKGVLELVIPAGASAGTYNWDSWIMVE